MAARSASRRAIRFSFPDTCATTRSAPRTRWRSSKSRRPGKWARRRAIRPRASVGLDAVLLDDPCPACLLDFLKVGERLGRGGEDFHAYLGGEFRRPLCRAPCLGGLRVHAFAPPPPRPGGSVDPPPPK